MGMALAEREGRPVGCKERRDPVEDGKEAGAGLNNSEGFGTIGSGREAIAALDEGSAALHWCAE